MKAFCEGLPLEVEGGECTGCLEWGIEGFGGEESGTGGFRHSSPDRKVGISVHKETR